jgi:hypothetical protein
MKQFAMTMALGALLISCGGKSNPAPSNSGGGGGDTGAASATIPPGIHGCTFTDSDGYTYGPHRCDVAEGKLDKLSGMELFTATTAASADGVVVTGTAGCEAMNTGCDVPFTITLKREGAGWRGPVVVDGGADWWVNGMTFEITDAAGYGGDAYGGDAYGGAAYGGAGGE